MAIKEVSHKVWVCDSCGGEIGNAGDGFKPTECAMCGKDLCSHWSASVGIPCEPTTDHPGNCKHFEVCASHLDPIFAKKA